VSKQDRLYNLVYVSAASRPFGERALLELLEQSRASNAKHGITGMLLFRDGAFMQALEGPKDEVLELFGRIEKDERHECVIVLYQGPIEARHFPDWSMGFKSPSEAELAKVEGYTSFLNFPNQPYDRQILASVARKLLDSFRRTDGSQK
jgi:hypothetical protein